MKGYEYKRSNRLSTSYFNIEGALHRTDGPAIEYLNGDKSWYVNGELHRTDGPAIEVANGDKAWFINGKLLTDEEVKRRTTRLGKALYL